MKVTDRGPIWGYGLSEVLLCSVGRPRGPDLSLQAASPLSLKTLLGAASLWPNRNTHCSSHPCPPILPCCHPQPRAISKPNQFPFPTETIVQALSPVVSRTPGQRETGASVQVGAVAFEGAPRYSQSLLPPSVLCHMFFPCAFLSLEAKSLGRDSGLFFFFGPQLWSLSSHPTPHCFLFPQYSGVALFQFIHIQLDTFSLDIWSHKSGMEEAPGPITGQSVCLEGGLQRRLAPCP